ncbi:MAG: helical backbone metal receptor [Candidatus Omnitrophota bacterium]
MKRAFLTGSLLMLFFFAACGRCASQPIVVSDGLGRTVRLEGPAEKVVSLNPSATEIIFGMAEGRRLTGITQFCSFPDQLPSSVNIGTVLDPDEERILALRPDLVIATVEGNRKKTVDLLEKAGLKVFVMGKISSFNDLAVRIREVGYLIGCEDKALEVINAVTSDINDVRQKTRHQAVKRVFVQIGFKPLVTVNGSTIINEMIEYAGGLNVAEGSQVRYPVYSKEAVAAEDPDVIMVVAMGQDAGAAIREWKDMEAMRAVRDGRIFCIDANIVCNNGPRLAYGVEEMARILHPEVFQNE